MTRIGTAKYRVLLEVGTPETTYEFDFVITGNNGEILVVESTNEFESFIGYSSGPVKHLFAAVLAFHKAQGMNIVKS